MRKINIGVIGCGNISGIYFENLINTFDNTNVVACADLLPEVAQKAAEKWGIKTMTVDEILVSDEIEIILNLTIPKSHFDVCKKALLAGKHVYVEKPLSLELADGKELVEIAKSKGLMIGSAPDTFMGGGIQTCKKIIEDGLIGDPIAVTANMMCHGHETWHPNPEFYYEKGGGPMFDMGPYYLTALIMLMGGVIEVTSMTNVSFKTRTITSEPKNGKIIDVTVPTHVNGLLRFENGAIGNIVTSFDIWKSSHPCIEIYGTKGSLLVPDPNTFDGPVSVDINDGEGYKEVPITLGYTENSRGYGVSDMAQCIIDGRTNNKASGMLANHVLEIMSAMDVSNNEKCTYTMTTEV